MAKSKKPNPKNYKIAGLIIVVLLFALIGVKFMNNSGASPVSTPQVGFYNYASVADLNNGVFTSIDQVPGIGTQTVADISPGRQLTFVTGGKQAPTSICYSARAYINAKSTAQATSADVTFVGTGNSLTVTLPIDSTYREVCVLSGRKAQLPYNISNLSTAADILLYQATVRY